MLTDAQITTIHRAVPYLPDGWSHNMMRSNQAAVWVDGPEMRQFRVGLITTHQAGERFHVWAVGMGENGDNAIGIPPEITVIPEAGPGFLAEEITRRFLPQYEEFYQAGLTAMQERAKKREQIDAPLSGDAVTLKVMRDQLTQLLDVSIRMREVVRASARHIDELKLQLSELLDDADQAIIEAQEWVSVNGENVCQDGVCTYSANE